MKARIRNNLLPYLMSCITVIAFLSVYTPWIPLVAVLVMVSSLAVFALCDFTGADSRRYPIYILAMIAVVAAAMTVFRADGTSMMFIVMEADFTLTAFLTLLFVCCFFVGSGIYYFSRILFRPYALLLLVLLPCTIYARLYLLIPVIYVALEIAVYFILLIDCRSLKNIGIRKSTEKDGAGKNFMSKEALVALAAVIFTAVMIMPKPTQTPYDQLRTRMMEGMTSQAQRLGDNTPGSSRNSNRVLFRVEAEEPLYLDLEVLSAYHNGGWVYDVKEDMRKDRAWGTFNRSTAPKNVWKLIWNAGQKDPNFAEKYGVLQMRAPDEYTGEKTAHISHAGFPTVLVPHPQHTYEASGFSTQGVTRNQLGELQLTGGSVAQNARYSLSYISRQKDAELVLAEFFQGFDDNTYVLFLEELEAIFQNDSSSLESVNALKQDFLTALKFEGETVAYASDKLQELAVSITEEFSGGYEKAAAITSYFHQNGFAYDLDFQTPSQYKGDTDYFVFESKTGTCANYATAMAMMGRSVGLNVRYTRGFYTGTEESPGVYQVTAMHYHAYPQVYLYGLGWTTFEPTVGYERTVSSASSVLENHEIMTIALAIAVALVAIGYLLRLGLGPAFREAGFRRELRKMGDRQAVLRPYDRLCNHLGSLSGSGVDSCTTGMVRREILDLCGADCQRLISVYEETAFAGGVPEKNERDQAFKSYCSACKALRKQRFSKLLGTAFRRKRRPYSKMRKRASKI